MFNLMTTYIQVYITNIIFNFVDITWQFHNFMAESHGKCASK